MSTFRHTRLLFFTLLFLAALVGTGLAVRSRILVGMQPDGTVTIPTGQTLRPAGTHIEVNDRPLGMVVSPNGQLLAAVTGSNFAPRALHIIDVIDAARSKQTIPHQQQLRGRRFQSERQHHLRRRRAIERGEDLLGGAPTAASRPPDPSRLPEVRRPAVSR